MIFDRFEEAVHHDVSLGRIKNIGGLAVDIDDTIARTGFLWGIMGARIANIEDPGHQSFSDVSGDERIALALKLNSIMPHLREDWHDGIGPCQIAHLAVTKLHLHKRLACYLTMRDSGLEAITERFIKENGFPDLPIIHPPEGLKDTQAKKIWKANFILNSPLHIGGIIDDDEVVIRRLIEAKYRQRLYHMDIKNSEECWKKILFKEGLAEIS